MDAQGALIHQSRASGEAYAAALESDDRRSSGRVYTPQPLVDFVLDLCGYTEAGGSILDPACGSGFFLLGAVERIARRLGGTPARWSTRTQRALLSSVQAQVFGIDVDPAACELARESVRRLVQNLVHPTALPPKYFERNVLCGDFLLSPKVSDVVAGWSPRFIVGNPPYVTTTRLTTDHKATLRKAFQTASGRLDLYTLFIEAGLRVLDEGGRLSFITPNKYLLSTSAKPLREFALANASLRAIANFDSHRVFDDAATVPCVTVFERGEARTSTVDVSLCGIKETPARQVEVRERAVVQGGEFGSSPWFGALSPNLRGLAARLRSKGPHLGAIVTRISAGIATGRDNLFVVGPELARGIEKELLLPVLRGREIGRYELRPSQDHLVLPYRFGPGGASLVALSRFPGAYRHLARSKADLLARHCVRTWGKKWYDVHDPVSFDLRSTTKIVVPDVADTNRFAVDPGTAIPLHSAYYIVPRHVEPYALTAILNSLPLEFLIRLEAPVVKDGFSRYRKQFLETLPIPTLDAADAQSLARSVKAGNHAAADALALRVWGLGREELDEMRQFLRNRRASLDTPR